MCFGPMVSMSPFVMPITNQINNEKENALENDNNASLNVYMVDPSGRISILVSIITKRRVIWPKPQALNPNPVRCSEHVAPRLLPRLMTTNIATSATTTTTTPYQLRNDN